MTCQLRRASRMPANLTDTNPLSPAPKRQWLDASDNWFYSATVNTDTFTIRLSANPANPESVFATPEHIITVRTAIDRAFWLIEQSGFFPHYIHRNISIILSDPDLPGQNIYYDDDGVTLLIGQSIINPSLLPQASGKAAGIADAPGTDRIVARLLNNMAMVVYEACDPNNFWPEFQARQNGSKENGGGLIPSPISQTDDVVSAIATQTQLDFISETLAAKWLNQKVSPTSLYWLESLLPDLFNGPKNLEKPPTPLSAELQARHWHSKNDLSQTLTWLKSEEIPSTGNVTRPVPDSYSAFTPVAPLLRIDETITCPAFGEGYRTHINGTEIAIRVYPQGDAAQPLQLVDITLDVKGYHSLGYKDSTQTLQRLVFDLEKLAGLFLYGGFNKQLLAFLRGLQVASGPEPDHKPPLIKAESDRLFIDSDASLINDSKPLIRLGAADLSRHSDEALGRGLSALLVPAWRMTLADSTVAVAGIEQLWGVTHNKLEILQPNYGLDESYQARQWPSESGDLYQRLVSGQRHNLRKRGGTAEDFVDAVRALYQNDGLATALARVMEDREPLTENTGEMADLLKAIVAVYDERPLRSEQWDFRRALDDSLDWLMNRNSDNTTLANFQRLKKNDEAQQGEYDGLAEQELALRFDNNTRSINGRFFTLKTLGDWIGVYLTPDYLASTSNQTITSDLRQLVDATDLFRRRVDNSDELRMLSGNVTTVIRPDTLGDIHDHDLMEVSPNERNRTIPEEYVSLIIPGRDGAPSGGESGPLTYLPIQNGADNDTAHDLALVNQTINNSTFTLIHFNPDEGNLPYSSGWLSGHISLFYQLRQAWRLALGLAPEEDTNAIKNRIRTDLGLPRHYPEQEGRPLPVVNPRQVMLKENLPFRVRLNQTTATDSKKSMPLAVTGYGALGRHMELTAEPEGNETYGLQLASIGPMTPVDSLLPLPLWRYTAVNKPAAGHRVRRSDTNPAEGQDLELMNKLIPDSDGFQKEFEPLLHYLRSENSYLNASYQNLLRAFKELDVHRDLNPSITYTSVLAVYERLIDLTRNHTLERDVEAKLAKLTTDLESWFKTITKTVPEKLHFVSVNPTIGELNRIRLWIAANSKSDLQVNLWYDPQAMLAGVLSEALKESVTSKSLLQTGLGDPSDFESDLFKELMALQDEAWKAIEPKLKQGQLFDQAAKDFLVSHLSKSGIDEKKTRMQDTYQQFKGKIESSYPRVKFSYENINLVWNEAFGEYSESAKRYYLRELGLRGDQDAARALVKFRVIDTLGGVYSDTSLTPDINRDLFKGLDYSGVSTTDWERVQTLQTQLIIQGFGREFLSDDQGSAIEQKVSDDLAWFGKKYPQLKSNIEKLVAGSDSSQLFQPLGKVKVLPGGVYVPPKKNPGLFFAASRGNPTIKSTQKNLLSQYSKISEYKLTSVTNWSAAQYKEAIFKDRNISPQGLAYYRFTGLPFANGHQALNGDLALKKSKAAMSLTRGRDALLDALQLSSREYFTIPAEAVAARDQENAIASFIRTDSQNRSQYSQELVIQMEPRGDNPIARASRYLVLKYKQRPDSYDSIRWLVSESDGWSDGETGAKVNNADIGRFLDGESRIHVVGLGASGGKKFSLSGQSASDLSQKINELTGDTPVKNINLIGSGIDHNGIVSQYLKDILKATKTRTVTGRDGLLRVDIWGRLWVGLLSDTGLVNWSLDDRPDRLKVSRTSSDEVALEYLPKKGPYVEANVRLRQMSSVLAQNSGLLGPVNPDDSIPTLAMFKRRLKPHLDDLSSDNLASLEEKITQFDKLRREGTTLNKYGLVYRMQENLSSVLAKGGAGASVSHLNATIKQYLMDALVEVPERLHCIWIGRLNEDVKNYLRVWVKMVPWPLTLWYDPKALLAPVLAQEIYKAVADEKIPESFLKDGNTKDEFLKRLYHLQDLAYSTIKKGIAEGNSFDKMAKVFLIKHLGMDRGALEAIQSQTMKEFTNFNNELIKLRRDSPFEGFKLADIEEIWREAANEASLTGQPSLEGWYLKELGHRGLLDPASDVTKVEIMKQGGVYFDADVLPPFNEKLFKHITTPGEIVFEGKRGYLINRAIMNYLGQPGPEQLFFNKAPAQEQDERYNSAKEKYPVFIKAIEEAIANHNKEPLFVFPESVKVIPGSMETHLSYGEKTTYTSSVIIAPPNSEVLGAVKKEIRQRYQLIKSAKVDDPLNASDIDKSKAVKSIAKEWNIDKDSARYIMKYRKDGIALGSKSTIFITGPKLFKTVERRYVSDFFERKDLIDHELKPFFLLINPSANTDLVNIDTPERYNSWVAKTDKTVRYALTSEQDSRYKNQIILQLGDTENEIKASRYLKNKYEPYFSRLMVLELYGDRVQPEKSGDVELKITKTNFINDGHRRLVDPETDLDINLETLQADFLNDDTRIIIVGHGSKVQGKKGDSDQFLLGGQTAEQVADVLKYVTGKRFVNTVSIVGCGTDASAEYYSVEHYPVEEFARTLFGEIQTKRITFRDALVTVDSLGRKWTGILQSENRILWSQSDRRVKLVLEPDDQGQLVARQRPVEEGVVKKLLDSPALPPGRDYVQLGNDPDPRIDQAKHLLLDTVIEKSGKQKLSDLIEHYNRQLQQLTGDDFSPYRLMSLPVADVELPSAQAEAPRALHMSAFVRADSLGDPFSGVGLLAYGDRFEQENFFRVQQAGYQLAQQVASSPSNAMAALFTRLLLGSLQDIVAPGGNNINPFRVSSAGLVAAVLAKKDLLALYTQERQNGFSGLSQKYVETLKELSGHFLADKEGLALSDKKSNEQRQWFQNTLSLGVSKRKRQPIGPVSFTRPVSLVFDDDMHNNYLPVVTNPSGETYVLVSVPESNSRTFPDNLRNILFMLQSSGPLEKRNAQTLIKTIESAYSYHTPDLLEPQLYEKVAQLSLTDVATLTDNINAESKVARSLAQPLWLRLVSSVITTLESGNAPDLQQKRLIAELYGQLYHDNKPIKFSSLGNPEYTVYLDPSLAFTKDQYIPPKIVLGVRSPSFITSSNNSAYRSQLRELLQLGGLPDPLKGVVDYFFNEPNEFIDSLLAWRKWELESGLEATRLKFDFRFESYRSIADSDVIVRQWEEFKPVTIRIGISDVRSKSSDTGLARVMVQSYGLALSIKLQASIKKEASSATIADLVKVTEIWQTDYHNYPDGQYGFDSSLTLRKLPTNSDPVYQRLILGSDDHDLRFAQGTVDDFQWALDVLLQKGKLTDSVRGVIKYLAMQPQISVNTFVEGLIKAHTDSWKQMQDSELRSALQLQGNDYQILKNRISSSDVPARDRDRLLSDLGNIQNPADKTSYTGKTPSDGMDVYGKDVKENSPGIISEVTLGSYGDKGLESKIAILFSAELVKHVLENDIPSKYLFSLNKEIIKTLRWLRTTSEFEGFSSALKEGQSQVFGNLQTLVDKGVIDGSVGSGFDQVKISDSVRLLLVITPPGSSGNVPPVPVMVNNAGSVLKIDPGQYFIEGKLQAEQYHISSGLMARYMVAANLLKGTSSDSDTIRKKILNELVVNKVKILQKGIESSKIPLDIHGGQIGLELVSSFTNVDAEPGKELAHTKSKPAELPGPYPDLVLRTDQYKYGDRSVIKIVTGPKPLSEYQNPSSALFDAIKTLNSATRKIPKGDYTLGSLVQDYNSELLGNNPKNEFKLIINDESKNNKVSLAPEAREKKSLPYSVQVNIGVDLGGIGDITSYISNLIAQRQNDVSRLVFQLSQYKASVISERLNLNSDLLKSMFAIHLYKQALDSSTNNFVRGDLGVRNSLMIKLEGLPRLGTGDFLMTVISDVDATKLKSAIGEYGREAFFSLMQEMVNDLASTGAMAQGAGIEWNVPRQQLEARLKLLFIDLLDYRIEHGRMTIPLSESDFFELPQGKNKEPKLGYTDSLNGPSRQGVSFYVSEEGEVRYLATIEVRVPLPDLGSIVSAPPSHSITALIQSVQNPGLLGANPDVDMIFFEKVQSLLTLDIVTERYRINQRILQQAARTATGNRPTLATRTAPYRIDQQIHQQTAGPATGNRFTFETETAQYRDWVEQSILKRLSQLNHAKLKHVIRSYNKFKPLQTVQGKLGQLLLTAQFRAITGGQSESAWGTLLQLQKIVSADTNLQRVAPEDQQLPATEADRHTLFLARWRQLVQLNLPTELYKILNLFSGVEGEGFIKPVLASGQVLSRYGISLDRLFHERTITSDSGRYLYQSHLNSDLPRLTVGIKDATFDIRKSIAIGKLFGIALINHPGVAALSDAQNALRAIWGLSVGTGRHYGLTTGMALVAFPDQTGPLYTRFIDGISTDHNWQFASGSVGDFARVIYGLTARYDQVGLTKAVERVLNHRRQHPGVSLDIFASALVETHRNLPDYQAGLVLRQAIGSDGVTFLKQALKESSPSLINGLNSILDLKGLDEHYVNLDSQQSITELDINKVIKLSVTPDYLRHGKTEYILLLEGIKDFLTTPLGKDYQKGLKDNAVSSDRLKLDAPQTVDGKREIVISITRSGKKVVINPDTAVSQQASSSSLIPVFTALVQSGYDLQGNAQADLPDAKDIDGMVRQQMGFAPLVVLADTRTIKKDNASGRIILEKTYTIDKSAKPESLQAKSSINIDGSPLITLKWLNSQPGLQLITAPLSPDELNEHRPLLDAAFQALDKTVSALSGPVNNKDLVRAFQKRLAKTKAVKKDSALGQLIFENDQTNIQQTKATGEADSGITLRLPFEDLGKPVVAALFGDSQSPEGERLQASLQTASRFVKPIAQTSGGDGVTHAQLRSMFALLLFRLSRDNPQERALFPGLRLADCIHTYLSDNAVSTLNNYIKSFDLQEVTDGLKVKINDLAQQIPGTPDPKVETRIKDLLGTALDYRLANGAEVLPATLSDFYSLPMADGREYRELWTGLMSEDSVSRAVFIGTDDHYLLDAVLPGQSGNLERLFSRTAAEPDNLAGHLKLALKPHWLGRDQEVTRAFIELAMSRVDNADWPWFSKHFSSLSEASRFRVVEALGQYRSQYPEADIKRLALALTEPQLAEVNSQISQSDQTRTPPAFRIRNLELLADESHSIKLNTYERREFHLQAGSLVPVTDQVGTSPFRLDSDRMLLIGSLSDQFPPAFLEKSQSERLYREAIQDRRQAFSSFQRDVELLIRVINNEGPKNYRQNFHKRKPLEPPESRTSVFLRKKSVNLSSGLPVHWQLNPHIPWKESRLRVGDTAVIIELGMQNNHAISDSFFDVIVTDLYGMSLAKSVEAADAELFRATWYGEVRYLRQLGKVVGFGLRNEWVSLPAIRNRDNTLDNIDTLLAGNHQDTLEHYFGRMGLPSSQEDFEQSMRWLFTRDTELLSLSLSRVSDYIQANRADPSIESFARALREFDQSLSDSNRARFRGAFTHQQLELLQEVLTNQIPVQWELINYLDTLKESLSSTAPVAGASGFVPSTTYQLVESDSEVHAVMEAPDPDPPGGRCRRGVDGCKTRQLLTESLADRPFLDIDSGDISDTDTSKPYYKVEFLTHKGELYRVLSRSGSDVTVTPLGESSVYDSIFGIDDSHSERVIQAGSDTGTFVAVRRYYGEVYQLLSEDGGEYRAVSLQPGDRLLASYSSNGETLIPVLEKNDHGQTVYGLKLDNAASDTNRLFKLNPSEPLEDQLAAARRADHLLLDDSAELRTLPGTDDRIAVILPADYRSGKPLATQAERLLSELRVFVTTSAGQRLVNALGFPAGFIKPASMTELDSKLLPGMEPPDHLRLVVRLGSQTPADRVIPYRPGGSGEVSGQRLVVLQVNPAVLDGQRHSTSNYLGTMASVLKDLCRAALASTDQAGSPAIAMTWLKGEKITGDRTLLQLENQFREQFGLKAVKSTAAAHTPVQTVTTAGEITTVETGQRVRIAYQAIADPLSGFGQLIRDGNMETRSLFQRVQYHGNQWVDRLSGASGSLSHLRALLTQVAWSGLVSRGMVAAQPALLADPVDVVVSILDDTELKALAGIDNLAGHLEAVLTDALKDRRGIAFTEAEQRGVSTWLSRVEKALTDAQAVRTEWGAPGQLPLGEDSRHNVPVTDGSRKTLALTSARRQPVTRLGDQPLIAIESQKGPLSAPAGDELTGLLSRLRQESPDSPQAVAALRTQLQWVPAAADPDYYRDAIERTLSPLSPKQVSQLDKTLLGLLSQSSPSDGEALLAEYFFHKRLKGLETPDPVGLRMNALKANEWFDLLQKNQPLPSGPGREVMAFIPDTGMGRHQARVQTTNGQKTFTLGRRDDLAFADQGPGYALIHSEDHRKVFRVELPDRWPDRLLQIRLIVHMEPYRRLERQGRIDREQLQNDIQLIARGMGESRLSNLLQALVQPVRDAGIADASPFKIRISPRPDWPLVDSRVSVNEENSAQVLLLLGTKDKNRPFIFRETLTNLVGASFLKALENGDGPLSALRQQVRQQFGINTATLPDDEPRPLGLTREYALTPVADKPSGTSLYRQLVEGHHNLLLAEGTEADYRRAVAYLELHDKARIQAIKDSLSKGEIKVSDSERTLFNKVVNEKQSSAPLIPDPGLDNNIASYRPPPSTSRQVDADYRAFWTVGSGMESLLDPNLLGLSRAAAENFLSYRAKVIYEDYGLRLVISDYLKSLVVHFIYRKMDQVLGSNGQPASQIHLGVTDAVTAILPNSDIKVINNLNLPPIGSAASMVAALEKACAFVARGLGWERFDTGLLANMNEDVHTVFQKAVKLRQQVGRSFQLPVHPQQDVQRSVQALPWQPETIETIASSPRHGVMADGDRRYLKITPAGPGNPFPLMSPQSQDGLKRLLRQPLKPGENAATTEAYLSQLARHYETFRELKDIDMTGQVNAVIDKMDDVTRQRFADSFLHYFLHYARQSAIPAGLAETIAGKLLVAEISALGSLPEKISTGLYQRLNGLLNLTGKRTFSLTSGNLTMRVLTDPSITADASYLMPAQRTLVLGNGAADSPLTAAAALALLQAAQAQKPEDQTKAFLALQQKRIQLPEGMDKLSPESLVSEFTVKEGKLTLSGLLERLTSFIGMAHRLNREGSSESRLLAREIRQNVADSLTALRSDIDFGQMTGIVDMTESHFRQALQKLDKAGLPAGQATRLPDADCVLCNGSGPVRTAMDLMDRISGHLDAIEVSDRFNHIRQTAGDKGLLADAFLLLEQGRFAAVATEDIQDSPVFRKKFLDLFRQTLTEQQGLTPEQVIDRVVSSLNDSGYSADDTRYVKEQLLKNQAFMEGLKTRKDHPGGSGFDANGPGGGSKKRPGKVTRMLDKLDRSKTYGRIKVGVGAGQSIVGLASGIQAIENLKKYGHILPDETRNLAYAGAGLEIGNSVYGLAMTSHWLVSSGKRLIKGSDAAGSGLKTLKTTTRAAKASRVVTRMVPVGGSFIGIAGAVVSITSNEMSARDARASGNDAQATYYEMMIALDAISIALDLVGMVLDFFPPFGVIADLVGQLLTVIQTVIAAFMPPNNARQEFDAIVQGDGFARYMDNMAKDFEKKRVFKV
ncbi:TcdA/TcdB catalytic glycosyltransferase domain-containing protein [Endozoicomonas sp. 8E]|uniref:TcdA/TcdB catalytic glycosyltransferase domain-containing protein n=1 Tax=Endozoicomonas sp. 8E TaxID=3035692 RepID=UPI002938E99F|nr:TcdA/TcdB catalytic glycosyltransferase domain-containing protein [Endozoicomonas sp. 8E]WOG29805.1 TcdA/TcdB catalytic glycosyltransferase domain-containing protein [Endozoicomonas sp. 8E]